jgi:branched-chain amino acid transport system ATP-binding protein
LARARSRKEISEGLDRAYAMFPRLGERRGQHAGTLSGGEQRMLSLARVLADPPRLLVVDELSLGLAPKIIDELYRTLRHVNEAGTALLIVEQYVARAVSLAQSVVVLQHGEVVYDGSVADLGDATERLLATHPHESN